jgi:energy-coupling factor transport system substrate-specific component
VNKKRILFIVGLLVGVVVLFWIGIVLYKDRSYNLISIILMVLACVPFYAAYEKKEGDIRRIVIVATMTALAVAGRFVFAPIPYFKPVTAIVIITAVFLGSEAGFLVGSLSAIISNMFFGQGPWTPFSNGGLGYDRLNRWSSTHKGLYKNKSRYDYLWDIIRDSIFCDYGHLDGALL